jgi:hypothetical protein
MATRRARSVPPSLTIADSSELPSVTLRYAAPHSLSLPPSYTFDAVTGGNLIRWLAQRVSIAQSQTWTMTAGRVAVAARLFPVLVKLLVPTLLEARTVLENVGRTYRTTPTSDGLCPSFMHWQP